MKPRSFAALAAAAAVCAIAAAIVYTSSLPWSPGTVNGAPLLPALRQEAGKVAQIELKRGDDVLTLARTGTDWLLKEHSGFPASNEKVRTLLVRLSEAELVEPKTQLPERYGLLELEDPGKGASSRLLRLLDEKGGVVAEVIIGKHRLDAFGSGQGGTYVRRPGERQTWLANVAIDAEAKLRDWVKPRVFEAQPSEVKHLTATVPGSEPLEIDWNAAAKEHRLANIPDGMKLKYVNSIDDIVAAASSFDFDDVRKAEAGSSADKSTVTLELENGLKVVIDIKREDAVAWLSFSATGEKDAKAAADALNARTKGWEFQVPVSKVNGILKKREDLIEKASS